MQWSGHYLDGRSAARHPVSVSVGRTGIVIAGADGTSRVWPLGECRQTQGFYAGEPVRFERAGESLEALVVDDANFLVALRDGSAGGRVHDPRGRGRRLRLTVAAAVGAVALAGAAYLWGIPAGARLATGIVPVAWEVRLGDTVFERVMADRRPCTNPEHQRILDGIVATLMATRPGTPYQMRVTVVDWATINAFALPGGRIVLTRGLLEFTDSAEMLAGTLAHEAQHVLQRHTTQALLQHASTGVLVGAISGDVSGLVAFGLASARALGALRYSRQAEEEADREGVRMLVDAGIDTAGDAAFFDKLARDRDGGGGASAVSAYLSTHPADRDRAAAVRARGRPARPAVKLLSTEDWKHVKRMCVSA